MDSSTASTHILGTRQAPSIFLRPPATTIRATYHSAATVCLPLSFLTKIPQHWLYCTWWRRIDNNYSTTKLRATAKTHHRRRRCWLLLLRCCCCHRCCSLFAESPWWRFADILFIDDVDYIQILITTVYIIVLCRVATVSTIVINA
jgi:hypothetical protein